MAAHQAPLSLGFSRQEHWSGLPFSSPMHDSEKWKWSRSVVSYPQWPHGLQPTRLLYPWDFPGKSTGVGCHCSICQQTIGANCGSDHELLTAKFRLKLKKVGKATRPFRDDLKSNPSWLYSGTDKSIQGIRSDRVPEELWTEVHDIV